MRPYDASRLIVVKQLAPALPIAPLVGPDARPYLTDPRASILNGTLPADGTYTDPI